MRSFGLRRTLLNIVASSLVIISFSGAAQARTECQFEESDGGFTGTVLVRGTPQEVFTAIKDSRSSERRKVLSVSGNSVLLEEKFNDLPVIGQARCRYREVEVPHQRIDCRLETIQAFRWKVGALPCQWWQSHHPQADFLCRYIFESAVFEAHYRPRQ